MNSQNSIGTNLYRPHIYAVMVICQSSEDCKNLATHWILVEYSWPTLPKEMRTYLLCKDHQLHAERSASNQRLKYPETGIKIVERGTIQTD